MLYAVSHLENDRDVSAYSRERRLLLRAQIVFSHVFKMEHRNFVHKGCIFPCVSLGALSDVTVFLLIRQSIHTPLLKSVSRQSWWFYYLTKITAFDVLQSCTPAIGQFVYNFLL